MKSRCQWAGDDPAYIAYHDREWGAPVHDDATLFEFLSLEGFQAGLSWLTILKKRENFRRAFDQFNPEIIAGYDSRKINELMNDPGIVRNRLKIEATRSNAQAFLKMRWDFSGAGEYLWSFTGGKTKKNHWRTLDDLPAATPESTKMSVELKKRGFKFVGPVICYAFMQAVGMVNDHTVDCFRHSQV